MVNLLIPQESAGPRTPVILDTFWD